MTMAMISPSARFLALVVSFSSHVFAQQPVTVLNFDEEWRWVHFTAESGLPSNNVQVLLESRDGTIWAGTPRGLAWFDNYRWISLDSTSGLPQDPVYNITEGDDGTLVVHVQGGVYLGNRQGFKRAGILPNEAKALEAVAFSGGTALVRPEVLSEFSVSLLSPIYLLRNGSYSLYDSAGALGMLPGGQKNIFKTQGGSYWLNTSRGLFRWEQGGWTCKLRSAERPLDIRSLTEDESGMGLVSVGQPVNMRGMWEWGSGMRPAQSTFQQGGWIRWMDIAPTGEVLALERSGAIFLRAGKVWSPLSPLPYQMRYCNFFRFSRNGDLWVSSDQGLYLYRRHGKHWTYLEEKSPAINRIHEITLAGDGSLWMATSKGVLVRHPDGRRTLFEEIQGAPLLEVTGCAEDDDGHIWITSGGYFQGAYRWDGRGWKYFKAPIPSNFHKVRKDRRGRLWFLGLTKPYSDDRNQGGGVYVYSDGHFERSPLTDSLLSQYVYAFREDMLGRLWFGTIGGLSRYDSGRWKHWISGKDLKTPSVFTMAVDSQNCVWFAAQGQGVGIIDQRDSLRYLTTEDGLLSDAVWDIAVDSRGIVWISTDAGLCSYNHGAWRSFDKRSGLLVPQLWPVWPAGDTVYAGTLGKGLAILSLRESTQPLPSVSIEIPTIEGRSATLRWQADGYWGSPPKGSVLTRLSLDGEPWSAWSPVGTATRTNLTPGQHSYRIQAQNLFGNFDSAGVGGSFQIASPLYLDPVFYLPLGSLAVTAVVLLVAFVARRRRDERALRKSEEKFRRLTESTFDGILLHDNGIILDINPRLTELFGYKWSEVIGKDMMLFIAPESKPVVEARRTALEEKPYEILCIKKDGSTIWVEVIANKVPSESPTYRVVAVRDITERKRSETNLLAYQEQLRSMASELSITEERERHRMASLLHDSVGQALAFCKIKLGALQVAAATRGAGLEKHLHEIRQLLDQAIHSTRTLTFDLSPPVLHEIGIEAALEALTERIQEQHGIRCTFRDDGSPKPLSHDFRTLLYHAVRELLTNVVKHARAQCVAVSIWTEANSIIIEVKDDGIGIPHQEAGKDGFGLFSIRERLSHLGGSLEMESGNGPGTRARIIAPCREEDTN